MREVVKIPGRVCEYARRTGAEFGCPYMEPPVGSGVGGDKDYCRKLKKPLRSGMGETAYRHPLCPYGNRVITVVMTDEEGKDE